LRFSIATVSLGGSLAEKLRAIAAAGFEGVEIFEADVLAHEGSPSEIGAMVRDHGLEVVAFQPFRDFEGMPEPQRSRGFERARRKFQLMQEFGASRLLQRRAGLARRDRPRRRRPPRARRNCEGVRHRGRLRGPRLGAPRQRLSRRLGDRAPR
jgi:sugar phosphate isomerase/epimerase